jgi:hypothetical protein
MAPKKYDYNEQNPFKKFDSSKTFEDRIKDLNDVMQADSKKSNSALKEISDTLKKQKKANESSESGIDKIADITEKNDKLSYLQEQQYDTQILLMKEQNNLLQQILDVFKEDDVEHNQKEDGDGFFSNFGFGMLAGLLSKSFFNLFAPIFKALFSPKGLLRLGGKLLKYIGAPVIGLLGAIDFVKGWGDPKEIVGRTGLAAKFQAGMSSFLSGLTLGMIDPKTISQTFDKFNDWMFENVTVPVIDFIKRIPEIIKNLPTTLKNLTVDFFNSDFWNSLMNFPIVQDIIDKTKHVFNLLKEKILTNLIEPIKKFMKSIQKIFTEIKDKVSNFTSKITSGLFDKIGEENDRILKLSQQQDIKEAEDLAYRSQTAIRYKIEKESKQPIKTTTNTNTQTANNNFISNSKQITLNGNDMSTRSDDLANQNLIWGF